VGSFLTADVIRLSLLASEVRAAKISLHMDAKDRHLGSTHIFAFVLVTLSIPVHAFARQTAGSVYAVGGVAAVTQSGPTGESPQTYVAAPGGTAAGWTIGGGVFLARQMSVEGEWATSGQMTAVEPSRYEMTFHEERRDRFFAFAARLYFPTGRSLRIEPIAGLVVTSVHATSQTDTRSIVLPQTVTHGPVVAHDLNRHTGLTTGCDFAIGRGRLKVLPSFRISQTGPPSSGSYGGYAPPRDIVAMYPGGYPRWTLRIGALLRADF
jgi:hypothetical protein